MSRHSRLSQSQQVLHHQRRRPERGGSEQSAGGSEFLLSTLEGNFVFYLFLGHCINCSEMMKGRELLGAAALPPSHCLSGGPGQRPLGPASERRAVRSPGLCARGDRRPPGAGFVVKRRCVFSINNCNYLLTEEIGTWNSMLFSWANHEFWKEV